MIYENHLYHVSVNQQSNIVCSIIAREPVGFHFSRSRLIKNDTIHKCISAQRSRRMFVFSSIVVDGRLVDAKGKQQNINTQQFWSSFAYEWSHIYLLYFARRWVNILYSTFIYINCQAKWEWKSGKFLNCIHWQFSEFK